MNNYSAVLCFLFLVFSIYIILCILYILNYDYYNLMMRETKSINHCFNISKIVTCARYSNRLYIRKRKTHRYRILLQQYGHNNINFFNHFSTYLVVIITEPNEFYERFVFRKIYKLYMNVTYVFIMGKSNFSFINKRIRYEIKLYKDIVQFNFLASYCSLMLQTYNILIWSSQLKIKFEWLIKHDTDTFFNINVLKYLHTIADKIYMQYIWGYILKTFPSGMGYVIPYECIAKLLLSSLSEVNSDCYSLAEDVFIGRLAKKSHIKLFDFRNYNKSIGQGNCIINSIEKYIMIHRLKPVEILFLHNMPNKLFYEF